MTLLAITAVLLALGWVGYRLATRTGLDSASMCFLLGHEEWTKTYVNDGLTVTTCQRCHLERRGYHVSSRWPPTEAERNRTAEERLAQIDAARGHLARRREREGTAGEAVWLKSDDPDADHV